MRRLISYFLAAAILLPTNVYAEETADYFIAKLAKQDPMTVVYLGGLFSGIAWGNGEMDGKNPIYCQPEKLSLTFEQEISILEEFVKSHPSMGKFPVGGVVLQAMSVTFPCTSKIPKP